MTDPLRLPESEHLTGPEADAVYAPLRLAELARLGLDRPRSDATLDRIVRTAASEFALARSHVSIVLDEAQLVLASTGPRGWTAVTGGSPIEWSFCRFAVATQAPFVVEDATVHADTHDNPLVTIEDIRCYAGAPLVSTRGIALGTLCVFGDEPRRFADGEIARLARLAREVMAHLERRATN